MPRIEIETICRSGTQATMNARLDQHGNRVREGTQAIADPGVARPGGVVG